MIRILPTDTCYGLAGDFTETDYFEIYRLKGRDFSKQLALLVENFEDMAHYIEITPDQIDFLRSYPHPWSFLGKRRSDFMHPSWMDAEKYQMLSLRVATVCLRAEPPSSFPLFLTSANLSGSPESKTLAEARVSFPGVVGIDGGSCDRLPSDIFSLDAHGEITYLRRNYG